MARRLAGLAARLAYREVEVLTVGEVARGPTVLVSNHFGGLADAVLLLHVSSRFPRILARDLIWRFPFAGGFMRWIGAIPVRHREDYGAGRIDNEQMFSACYRALAEDSLVLIFPEGVTQDVPYLAPVRTGAARIALGARASGVPGMKIQPVGIHYEDKAAFRSRVLVSFGEPLAVDDLAILAGDGEPWGPDDRDAVRSLTDEVTASLRRAAPDYSDWAEAHELQLAARTTLRTLLHEGGRTRPVPLAASEPVAAALARLPADVLTDVRERARHYREGLAAARLDDPVLGDGRSDRPTPRLLGDALLVLALLPYALLGAALVAIPYLLTQSTRFIPAAPAVRATILPAVALVTFVVEWVWLSVEAAHRDGWSAGLVAALLAPAFAAATVLVSERSVLVWRDLRRWWTGRRRTPRLEELRSARAALVGVVVQALRKVGS